MPLGRVVRFIQKFAFVVLCCVLTAAVAEGLSSFVLSAKEWLDYHGQFQTGDPIRAYDPLLGWSNRAGGDFFDVYSPGTEVHINSQGFRARYDIAPKVEPGKLRVIFSGDSFTFGTGVGDDDVWTSQLAVLDPRLEPVNLSTAGYAADQMYLRYLRDGVSLDHQAHLFCVITDDFYRMQHGSFMGHERPEMRLAEGALTVVNEPVGRPTAWGKWWAQNRQFAMRLRFVTLGAGVLERYFAIRLEDRKPLLDDENLRNVTLAMLDRLRAAGQTRGAAQVIVYLPVEIEYPKGSGAESWREFLGRETLNRGIVFVDLTDEFRSLPPHDVAEMFLRRSQLTLIDAVNHYTPRGHRFVAEAVSARLREIAPFAVDKAESDAGIP